MTATPAMHALVRGSYEPRAVCGKPAPAHRLVWPNTATLLTRITCRCCRTMLGWPAAMDPLPQEEREG